ncbi:MAG: carbohydrate-binding protein, partial [Bacteroidales bacterium]|nr:carbohydrate-binding protein [Bacteroidales bacterium]
TQITAFLDLGQSVKNGGINIGVIGENDTCSNPPNVTIADHTDATCGNSDGSITLSFSNNENQSNIFLSIDGGRNYTSVPVNAGSYVFNSVAKGSYYCIAKWENDACLTNIGGVEIKCTGGVPLPGLIEAETYSAMSGVDTETTSDDGGGLNVGFIDDGDWMDYDVEVTTAGTYIAEFRVASKNSDIKFDLKSGNTILSSVTTGTSGHWQNWKSVSTTVDLTTDIKSLRIQATGSGWNINWMRFSLASSNCSYNEALSMQVYPNLVNEKINVELANKADAEYQIYSLSGALMDQGLIYHGKSSINVSTLVNGMYIIKVHSGTSVYSHKFTVKH